MQFAPSLGMPGIIYRVSPDETGIYLIDVPFYAWLRGDVEALLELAVNLKTADRVVSS